MDGLNVFLTMHLGIPDVFTTSQMEDVIGVSYGRICGEFLFGLLTKIEDACNEIMSDDLALSGAPPPSLVG